MWYESIDFSSVQTQLEAVAPVVLVGLLGIVVTVGIVTFVINRTRRVIR